MPGVFPAEAQPRQGQADAAQADPLPVHFAQVLAQQGRGPHAGVVAVNPGILVNDGINQRINDSLGGRGPATPGGIRQPLGGRKAAPLLKPADPVVNGPPGNMQVFGGLRHAFALIQ
jgi:hypothetical protein